MRREPQWSAAGADLLHARGQASLKDETKIPIQKDQDIVVARQKGRALAQQLGFSNSNLTLIATAISELARNILLYAKRGEMTLGVVQDDGRDGIAVVASDNGPGIHDIARALELGFSTSGSLGLGLPGVKRLMDEFEIVSGAGRGTTVTATKWKR
jgi:serine/threonine-protein kinase RsbT